MSWDTIKFEIELLTHDGLYGEAVIKYALRRAFRGNAHTALRLLGVEATVEEIVKKLDSTYGSLDSRETVLRKLYSCKQEVGEDIVSYSGRLEDLFDKAAKLDGVKRDDMVLMKALLYEGLVFEMKSGCSRLMIFLSYFSM